MTPAATVTEDQPAADVAPAPAEVESDVLSDVLVEEISIDGMCGVY
jgi:mycofactocin precursor